MGFHAYCSLDEYCFPHLSHEALAKRNADQTLTRYKEISEKELETIIGNARYSAQRDPDNESGRKSSGPLLVAPQAFIWMVDDLLIIALPVAPPQTFWKLLSYFLWGVGAKEVIGLLLYAIVEDFDPGPRNKAFLRGLPSELNKDKSTFKIFSRSIASVSEQVSKYLEDQDVDNITATREHNYIHQIMDIREEISMIRSIITEQEEVWRTFVSNAWPVFCKQGPQGDLIFQYTYASRKEFPDLYTSSRQEELMQAIGKPQYLFKRLKQRLQGLDDDAARVERSIELRLDLKQKHASFREAHKATLMSASVIGFTLITAIFTPLSFMISLFALPIDRFQKSKVGKGDDAYYTTDYIGWWMSKPYDP